MAENDQHSADRIPDPSPSSLAPAADPVAAVLARLPRKLIREEPETARAILDALDLEDRARVVMRFPGRDRLELILLSEDSSALVQTLPPGELWLTIKEIGEEDALDLIRMAGPDQLTHLTDLEWWHRDRLDPLAIAYWLMLFHGAGPKVVTNWFKRADEELLVAVFSKFFKVYQPDPDNQGAEPWRDFQNLWTLDDAYFLHFQEPGTAPAIERALSLIRAEEPMKYYGLLEAIDALPLNEQEAEAARFREARLADVGFVEFEEAMLIYEPLSDRELEALYQNSGTVAEKAQFETGVPAPAYPLSLGKLPPLLGQALSRIEDRETLEDLQLAIMALTNRLLIADQLDLSRLDSLTAALKKALAFLDLGLQRWSKGDLDRAVRVLRGQPVFAIFRAGYTRVIALARAAYRLEKEGSSGRPAFTREFPGADAALIAGLSRPRPQFYEGADDQGAPRYREFFTEEEIGKAEAALERAEFSGLLFFQALSLAGAELELLRQYRSGTTLTPETVFLTAAGHEVLGHGLKFTPLGLGDAKLALGRMLTEEKPRRVGAEAREELIGLVDQSLRRLAESNDRDLVLAREFAARSLDRLESEARDLDLSALDPRYFNAMVILPE